MDKKIKILLVDDLNDNLLALEGLLRRSDVEIIKARSGLEALEIMINHDFAVALLDVQMPGMSGFELAEFMRGTKKTKNIPIVFVTATAHEQSFSFKGYESGAVDFLLKPLDGHAVKSKVNIFIELYQQRITLKQVHAALELAVQTRDEFISIASHELKTPLTSLILCSQLRKRMLEKGNLAAFSPERLTKMFEDDARQLGRLHLLIDDMLDIARINSGKLSMTMEQFDLCELVHNLVDRTSEQFILAGCAVKLDACEPIQGNWDYFRIEQVVTNLLTNAMRYGAGRPIFIALTSEAGEAHIIVRDSGSGIAKENLERIFQRFERAVGNEISGLGLGLYIVRQILEAHGGSITVESVLGEGSTFRVILPGVKDSLK